MELVHPSRHLPLKVSSQQKHCSFHHCKSFRNCPAESTQPYRMSHLKNKKSNNKRRSTMMWTSATLKQVVLTFILLQLKKSSKKWGERKTPKRIAVAVTNVHGKQYGGTIWWSCYCLLETELCRGIGTLVFLSQFPPESDWVFRYKQHIKKCLLPHYGKCVRSVNSLYKVTMLYSLINEAVCITLNHASVFMQLDNLNINVPLCRSHKHTFKPVIVRHAYTHSHTCRITVQTH